MEIGDDESQSLWQQAVHSKLGRVVMAAGLSIGLTAMSPAEASADTPTCYGDYCSGKYADETHCDEDARTIAEAVITRPGVSGKIGIKGIEVGAGNNDPDEIGRLHLRASDKCGTTWGRINTKAGSSWGVWGVQAVGAQQDGGYTQERDIGGVFVGSPPAVSFGPMIYGRGREYRAYVKIQLGPTESKDGTYWVEGPKK